MNQNNATNKIATQVSECKIVITRVLDAPRDLVLVIGNLLNTPAAFSNLRGTMYVL